jgi:hypothetical protein
MDARVDLGVALTREIFDDAGLSVADHRAHRDEWYSDLAGALMWPVSRVESLWDALAEGDDPISVVLVADTGLDGVRVARGALIDEDRIDVVGIRLLLKDSADPGRAARSLLDELDLSTPSAIEISPTPGWQGALDALAEDGAERAAWRVDGDARPLALFLRSCLDRSLSFSFLGGGTAALTVGAALGTLNLLAASAAAVRGADADHIGRLLTIDDSVELLTVVRESDPRMVRRYLGSMSTPDIATAAANLHAAGLSLRE